MRIIMVGAGNLATSLVPALSEAGHEVLCVYSRTMSAARQLADTVGAQATDDCSKLPHEADVCIISVKDAALASLIPDITKGRQGMLFVHTAGSMPMALFDGYASRYGVMYPMQTFSKSRPLQFCDIPTFLEADNSDSLSMLHLLAESISDRVYELDSEKRRHLHLAAVFACNFVNHCYALSSEILADNGLPFDVMLPLIDETARKVHELHPVAAQTGPAVRYDQNVIQMQLSLLSGRDNMKEVYSVLSRSIHDMHLKHG